MKLTLTLALATVAIAALPLAAQAQTAGSSTISLTADVAKQCAMGVPSSALIALGDLTGPDGRLTPALFSGVAETSVTFTGAWCNAPNTLAVDAEPMMMPLASRPAYSSPVGFSRELTYTAAVEGLATPVSNQAAAGTNGTVGANASAYSADLVLRISNLRTLGAGDNLIVEAGTYTGSVVVTVTAP